MRRPAQHRLGPAATGWVRPYTGVPGMAVFYNSGADPTPPTPPAGEPGTGTAPKPGPPAPSTVSMTQDELTALAAKEKSQGERAGARKALEKFAADHGFTTVEDAETFIAAARKAQQDALSEEERRRQELDQREQELAAKEAAAAVRERAAIRKAALLSLGATGTDLEDALALLERDLRDTPDADETAVQAAAEALKARREYLFGATAPAPTPNSMPPAPGGAPAGGPPPRQTPAGKPGDRGREMARLRGHNRNAA